jgi:hypothetical protein
MADPGKKNGDSPVFEAEVTNLIRMRETHAISKPL